MNVEVRFTLSARHAGQAPQLGPEPLELAGELRLESFSPFGAFPGPRGEVLGNRPRDGGGREGRHGRPGARLERGPSRVEAGFALGEGVLPGDGHRVSAAGLVDGSSTAAQASRSGTTRARPDATRVASFSTFAATSSNNKKT